MGWAFPQFRIPSSNPRSHPIQDPSKIQAICPFHPCKPTCSACPVASTFDGSWHLGSLHWLPWICWAATCYLAPWTPWTPWTPIGMSGQPGHCPCVCWGRWRFGRCRLMAWAFWHRYCVGHFGHFGPWAGWDRKEFTVNCYNCSPCRRAPAPSSWFWGYLSSIQACSTSGLWEVASSLLCEMELRRPMAVHFKDL